MVKNENVNKNELKHGRLFKLGLGKKRKKIIEEIDWMIGKML